VEVRPEDVWKLRLEATLRKAEKLMTLYGQAVKDENEQWARNYYKHAKREAREASKLLGVLEIEFGAGMAQAVERTRKVYASLAHAALPGQE